jgi:hypothetical protein
VKLSRQARAFIASLLLVLQVVGLGHVALARHELSESGAIVDVQPVLFDSHADTGDHLCADDVAIHADAQGDCLVMAGWSSVRVVGPQAMVLSPASPLARPRPLRTPAVTSSRDVLARAPKGSPPRG